MRTVRRAQEGFVAADPVAAALHTTRWGRDHLAEARVLLLYRREDLAARWPAELGEELATLNDAVAAAIAAVAQARYGRAGADARLRMTFAIVDVPYAVVRRHLLAGRRLVRWTNWCAPRALRSSPRTRRCRPVRN